MTLINCKDGTGEYINTYRDIIELVKEKISYDLGNIMESEYNFDDVISQLYEVYSENEKIHKKIIESEDIEEIRNAYDSIYWCIGSIL